MRHRLLYIFSTIFTIAAISLAGCKRESVDEVSLDAEYGYVQFRLVKEGHAEEQSRATDALEWLAEAHKVTVVMQRDGSTITQTLPLSSYDTQTAEWGLQSEKLRLITG